jgi:ABC-type polysaccharide/polyol phosphate transport system ATPase subunit
MDTAVRATALSKHYRVYRRPADRLVEIVTRQPRHTRMVALDDVTFDVQRGETVGVIGQNGAGKSTLLKLLSGVTTPSSGSLAVEGTIASILELGTGFHPEFSGRDNAALNAAILGLPNDEVKRRLPAILEFSELGSFVDQPVKTYSSGMYMRLAFSVAVNVDPDVLIIDEALAVGDGHFQKKCTDKIREFQESGKTILFCSHALYYISTICRRALWLDHGKAMRFGPSLDVVHEYETFLLERDRTHPSMPDESAEIRRATTPVRVTAVELRDRSGAPRTSFSRGDDIVVRVRISSDTPRQPVHILVGVHRSADDLQCFAVATHEDGFPPLAGRTEYELDLQLMDVPLLRGDYTVIVYAGDENAMTVFDRRDLRPGFSISGERFEVGLIAIRHRWDEVGAIAPITTPATRR